MPSESTQAARHAVRQMDTEWLLLMVSPEGRERLHATASQLPHMGVYRTLAVTRAELRRRQAPGTAATAVRRRMWTHLILNPPPDPMRARMMFDPSVYAPGPIYPHVDVTETRPRLSITPNTGLPVGSTVRVTTGSQQQVMLVADDEGGVVPAGNRKQRRRNAAKARKS